MLTSPEAIAFGTVADLAQRAATSGATVVRLAAKLGYDGFTSMQSAVQDELGQRLRPAAERIREVTPSDVLGRVRSVELDNVAGTLEAASPGAFDEVVAALADESFPVHVLAGEASRGIGMLFADELSMLRAGVSVWFGADVRLARHLAAVRRGDVLVAIDHRRYERWVLDTTRLARERGRPRGCPVRQRPVAAGRPGVVHVRGAGRGGRAVRQPRRHRGPHECPRRRGGRHLSAAGDGPARRHRGGVARVRRAPRRVSGASFAERAAEVIATIAPGDVWTYGEVAESAGRPGAARAVGHLLATSGDDLPWWRVVAANGRLVRATSACTPNASGPRACPSIRRRDGWRPAELGRCSRHASGANRSFGARCVGFRRFRHRARIGTESSDPARPPFDAAISTSGARWCCRRGRGRRSRRRRPGRRTAAPARRRPIDLYCSGLSAVSSLQTYHACRVDIKNTDVASIPIRLSTFLFRSRPSADR